MKLSRLFLSGLCFSLLTGAAVAGAAEVSEPAGKGSKEIEVQFVKGETGKKGFLFGSELSAAIVENNLEKVKEIIKQKPQLINHREEAFQVTPLHEAVGANNIEITKILLENKADANAIDYFNDSPLAIAQTIEMADLLIKYGADFKVKFKTGDTIMHKAVSNKKSDPALIDYYEKKGLDIKAKNNEEKTPLMCAAQLDLKKTEILIQKGAVINEFDQSGWTPLHYAAYADNLEIAKLLIKNKAVRDAHMPYRSAPEAFAKSDAMTILLRQEN